MCLCNSCYPPVGGDKTVLHLRGSERGLFPDDGVVVAGDVGVFGVIYKVLQNKDKTQNNQL